MDLTTHLLDNNWVKKKSQNSNLTYFVKTNCDITHELSDDKHLFKSLGKKANLTLNQLHSHFNAFFLNKTYSTLDSLNVINRQNDTFFIGAGVQAFYHKLINNNASMNTKYILSQPSIRISSFDKIGKSDGYSTSFVNLCTQQASINDSEHITHLENWLTFLSKIGLYAGHIKLIEDPNWKGGDFMNGESLLIYYGNLQIGDAVLISAKNKITEDQFKISDIGFGLERINWALNKTKKYYDCIGPKSELIHKNVISADMIRTLTLMSMSNLHPSNNNAGYRFKQFIKNYISNSRDLHPYYLIEQYYNFWTKFVPQPNNFITTRNKIVEEIHIQTIANIQNTHSLNLDKKKFMNFEEFITECELKNPEYLNLIEKYLKSLNSQVVK